MDRGNPEILGHTNGFLGILQLHFPPHLRPISWSRVMFHQVAVSVVVVVVDVEVVVFVVVVVVDCQGGPERTSDNSEDSP